MVAVCVRDHGRSWLRDHSQSGFFDHGLGDLRDHGLGVVVFQPLNESNTKSSKKTLRPSFATIVEVRLLDHGLGSGFCKAKGVRTV